MKRHEICLVAKSLKNIFSQQFFLLIYAFLKLKTLKFLKDSYLVFMKFYCSLLARLALRFRLFALSAGLF
jgi:hypothetical protein